MSAFSRPLVWLGLLVMWLILNRSLAPGQIILGMIVATLASWRYWRAGQTDIRLLLMFAVTAVPAAFIGGAAVVCANGAAGSRRDASTIPTITLATTMSST